MGKPARRPSPHSALADALRLQERLSRLLERAIAGPDPARLSPAAPKVPAIDLLETPRAFLLSADLAGVEPRSLEIALAPRALALFGRLRGAATGGRRFRRRIGLPAEIDPRSARGSLRRGVLRLRVAKRRRLRLLAKAPRKSAGRT